MPDASLLRGSALTFDQTVPRALVDRGDTTTVLVTSWTRGDGDDLCAGACWPRLGGYYSLLDHDTHDPLLVLETFRQVGLLAAHILGEIPEATMQVMRFVQFTAIPSALRITAEPTEVAVATTSERLHQPGSSIGQGDMAGALYRGEQVVGYARGRVLVPLNGLYPRVRGRDPRDIDLSSPKPLPPSIAPRDAGRDQERDVVISPGDGAGTYRLRVDPEHPNFFDNPTDHTPGMLLIEAMRQAVVAHSADPYLIPVSMSAWLHRFVELDHPAEVTVRRDDTGFVTEISQSGKRTTQARWQVASLAGENAGDHTDA